MASILPASAGPSEAYRAPSETRLPSASPASEFIRELAAAAAPGRGVGDLLTAESLSQTLHAWAARRVGISERLTRAALLVRLGEDIAAIDGALTRQIDTILHNPRFQQIESSWRGLAWLVGQSLDANDAADGRSQV